MANYVKHGGMYLPKRVAMQDSIRQAYASGYREAGASLTKRVFKGMTAESHSPTEDIDAALRTLRERSRILYMSTSIAAAAINTNRTKIVGTGLQLRPEPNGEVIGISSEQAQEWADRVEAEFALWAGSARGCDVLEKGNFVQLQALVTTSWLMNGDVAVLFQYEEPSRRNPYSMRLHLIEADRICTPAWAGDISYISAKTEGVVPDGKPGAGNKIHDGVEVDASGKVVAYYICNCYPQDSNAITDAKWERVEAYGAETGLPNILLIGVQERCEQYRGVPYLAPVIEELLQLRRYTDSELMAALIQTMVCGWIETNAGTTEYPFNEVGSGVVGADGNPVADNIMQTSNEYSLGSGTVQVLEPGESIKLTNPQIPTAGYNVFTQALEQSIGAALELPREVMCKAFTNNYSASRGALVEAWEGIMPRRNTIISGFCQPVYERWLTEAVAIGRIEAPGFFDDPLIHDSWTSARWIGPVQGALDPVKEAQAAALLAAQGFKTRTQLTSELGGGDWWQNIIELARENQSMAEALAVLGEHQGDLSNVAVRDGDGDGEIGEG